MRAGAVRLQLSLWCLICCVAVDAVGCGVYDPSLVHGSASSAQSTAGRGAGDTGEDAVVRCESGDTCKLDHARAVCVNNVCLIVSCNAPYADCDEQAANGCEANLESADHCGRCNTACKYNHADGQCKDGRCSLGECDVSYDNCDNNANNGCEQKVDSLNDCGACNVKCDKPPHATAGCKDGACGVGTCDRGWGDCNGNAADGCEQPLDDRLHCGSCDVRCELPHTEMAACENAHCVVKTCAKNFDDCNGAAEDGCEAQLSKAGSCGGCGQSCDLPHTAAALCSLQSADATCLVDHTCSGSGDVSDECDSSGSAGCAAGFGDCDGDAADGCETNLKRLSSCGACGVSCVQAHALTACEDGRCVRKACDPGYGACKDTGDCTSLLDDAANCGSCGNVCSGNTSQCAGGKCTGQVCQAGRADCDGNAMNGCEVDLNSDASCGGCDQRCEDAPHATMACKAGGCAIERCDNGFADCDKDPRNGCEVDLNGMDDCGACGNVCSFPHSGARCNAGKCERADCDENYADCNMDSADGCETNLLLPGNCGSCGNSCRSLPNVTGSTCEKGGCAVQCQRGRGNCDNQSNNGCETDLTAATSCGSCGTDCTHLANTKSARCGDSGCTDVKCNAGFADCNGSAADGCERSLSTLSDCGACDKPCAVAHAAADCSSGKCEAGACDEGFGDCDGNASNGCETALNDDKHCGSCGNACGEGISCVNGACGCTDDSQCKAGSTCCDGRCVGTVGTCYPWPCIPGTAVVDNQLNCGGCGAVCLTWCCGPLL